MAGEHVTEKLDAYFDGELSTEETRAVDLHMRGCPTCATEGLSRVQQKRAVQSAGQKFAPDPAFRARMEKKIAGSRSVAWKPRWVLLTAIATLLIVAASVLLISRQNATERQVISELVDQHVTTLASASPVDVVSTDRHTVKPWFEGKIPFTFNLPELQGSPFVLVGGRLSYLKQSPGAELIFRVRQHQISVFIFREQDLSNARVGEDMSKALSFEIRSWRRNELRYFVIGDASPEDLDKLRDIIKAAG